MDDARPVLVLTELDDPTADLVIAELGKRHVPVVRLDPGDFPRHVTFDALIGDGRTWSGRLQTPTRDTPLAARALYYRRPSPYTFPGLDEQDARYAAAHAEHGLGGVLATLPGCLYVNHPQRNRAAEYKPGQLAAAVKLGLKVPATLITNSPVAAHSFALTHGPVVHKPLRLPPYAVDGVPHTCGRKRSVRTTSTTPCRGPRICSRRE
jgi:hypothetical protein